MSAELPDIAAIEVPEGAGGQAPPPRGVAPFLGLDRLEPAVRRTILGIAKTREYERGAVIVRQDDESDELHLLDRGRVAVRRQVPAGASVLLAVLGPGSAYGESALTGRRPRIATITALDEVQVTAVPRDAFEDLREREPALERFLVDLMDWRLHVLMDRLIEAATVPAERRVLRRVHELAVTFRDPARRSALVPLPQEDVAGLASVTRPTANRVLQAAAQQGLLQLGWRRVEVPDLEALERAGYGGPGE